MTVALKPTEIKDQPVPTLAGGLTEATGGYSDSVTGDMPTPTDIPDIATPRGFVASEVIAESLDTQAREIKGNYTFAQLGAILIGTTTNGILISPTGILAKNGGVATVTIDSNGNATFKGTVAAGSIVTGYLAVGSAASDVNSGSTTIDGGKITTGSIFADQIAANTITAGKLSISQLSAISANLGTITAGIINGVTIQLPNESLGTGSAGKLIWASNARIWGDSSGNIGINGVGGQVIIYAGSNQRITVPSSGQTNIADGIHATGSGNINADGSLQVNGTIKTNDDKIQFQANGGGQYLSIKNMGLTSSRDGSNQAHLDWGNGAAVAYKTSGSTWFYNGNTKTAIVPTSKGYRALYSMESPEVWFMDFARIEHKWWQFWKKPTYVVDITFLEVASGPYVIMPTLSKGWVQIWGHRKGYEKTRFEEKTEEEFKKNEEFLQMSKVVK